MWKKVQNAITAVAVAAVGAVLAVAFMPVAGQAPVYRAPRTASGKPDLNGVWQALNEANYDIQAHTARPAMALRSGPYGPVPISLHDRRSCNVGKGLDRRVHLARNRRTYL